MAAMATCTQAFAGLRLKASAKASPAKLSAKTTLGAKPVARAVVMSRTTRAHRLTVRAATTARRRRGCAGLRVR